MRTIILVAAACLFVQPAAADDAIQGRLCAAIADDAQRLACFDLVFKKTVSETAPAGESGSNWSVRTETSKLDDTTNVFVSNESIGKSPAQFGGEKSSWLMITCRENTTSLYISFAGHFMSSIQGKGKVTYRLDKEPARTQSFTESNDHSVLGLWTGGTAVPFIKKMLGKQSLLVRATPFSDSAVTAEFRIGGLDRAIEGLRKACGW